MALTWWLPQGHHIRATTRRTQTWPAAGRPTTLLGRPRRRRWPWQRQTDPSHRKSRPAGQGTALHALYSKRPAVTPGRKVSTVSKYQISFLGYY